jgi:hypothetical protein
MYIVPARGLKLTKDRYNERIIGEFYRILLSIYINLTLPSSRKDSVSVSLILSNS